MISEPSYVITGPAKRDIEELAVYIGERFGVSVLDQVETRLYRLFERLAEFPESGRERPELWPPPYRFVPFGPSLVAFRGDVEPLQIIRVRRAAQDWPRLRPNE